jgi:heptosyltransferase-2
VTEDLLVIRFSSLGDVILVEPVFRALRARLPDARITFLTLRRYAPLHASHPDLDAVWAFEPERESLAGLRRQVRDAGYALIVDLHRSLRSRAVTFGLETPRTRMAKQHVRRLALVARPPLKRRVELTPVVDRYLAAVGAVGEEGAGRVPVIHLTDEQRAAGRRWRERILPDGAAGGDRPLVALLPGARHAPKRWPREHIIGLAALLRAADRSPVIIPAPDGERWTEQVEGVVTSPLEDTMSLAGALAACDAVVANDSGPMHLAAAVGTPVVGLFGPTSPALGFAPVSPQAVSMHLDLHCSPCSRHGQTPCWRERRYCMEDMAPEAVLRALQRALEGGSDEKVLAG